VGRAPFANSIESIIVCFAFKSRTCQKNKKSVTKKFYSNQRKKMAINERNFCLWPKKSVIKKMAKNERNFRLWPKKSVIKKMAKNERNFRLWP
jgi:hypothetical protein